MPTKPELAKRVADVKVAPVASVAAKRVSGPTSWGTDHPLRGKLIKAIEAYDGDFYMRIDAFNTINELALGTDENKINMWNDGDLREALFDCVENIRPSAPTSPEARKETPQSPGEKKTKVEHKRKASAKGKAKGRKKKKKEADEQSDFHSIDPASTASLFARVIPQKRLDEFQMVLRVHALWALVNLSFAPKNQLAMWDDKRVKNVVHLAFEKGSVIERQSLSLQCMYMLMNFASVSDLQGQMWNDSFLRRTFLECALLTAEDTLELSAYSVGALMNLSSGALKDTMWQDAEAREVLLRCAESLPYRELFVECKTTQRESFVLEHCAIVPSAIQLWTKAHSSICNLTASDSNKMDMWSQKRIQDILVCGPRFPRAKQEPAFIESWCRALGALSNLAAAADLRPLIWEDLRVRRLLLRALSDDDSLVHKAAQVFLRLTASLPTVESVWDETDSRIGLIAAAAKPSLELRARAMLAGVLQNFSKVPKILANMWKELNLRQCLDAFLNAGAQRNGDASNQLQTTRSQQASVLECALGCIANLASLESIPPQMWSDEAFRNSLLGCLNTLDLPNALSVRARLSVVLMYFARHPEVRGRVWEYPASREALSAMATVRYLVPNCLRVNLKSVRGLISTPDRLKQSEESDYSGLICSCEVEGRKIAVCRAKNDPSGGIVCFDATLELEGYEYGDIVTFRFFDHVLDVAKEIAYVSLSTTEFLPRRFDGEVALTRYKPKPLPPPPAPKEPEPPPPSPPPEPKRGKGPLSALSKSTLVRSKSAPQPPKPSTAQWEPKAKAAAKASPKVAALAPPAPIAPVEVIVPGMKLSGSSRSSIYKGLVLASQPAFLRVNIDVPKEDPTFGCLYREVLERADAWLQPFRLRVACFVAAKSVDVVRGCKLVCRRPTCDYDNFDGFEATIGIAKQIPSPRHSTAKRRSVVEYSRRSFVSRSSVVTGDDSEREPLTDADWNHEAEVPCFSFKDALQFDLCEPGHECDKMGSVTFSGHAIVGREGQFSGRLHVRHSAVRVDLTIEVLGHALEGVAKGDWLQHERNLLEVEGLGWSSPCAVLPNDVPELSNGIVEVDEESRVQRMLKTLKPVAEEYSATCETVADLEAHQQQQGRCRPIDLQASEFDYFDDDALDQCGLADVGGKSVMLNVEIADNAVAEIATNRIREHAWRRQGTDIVRCRAAAIIALHSLLEDKNVRLEWARRSRGGSRAFELGMFTYCAKARWPSTRMVDKLRKLSLEMLVRLVSDKVEGGLLWSDTWVREIIVDAAFSSEPLQIRRLGFQALDYWAGSETTAAGLGGHERALHYLTTEALTLQDTTSGGSEFAANASKSLALIVVRAPQIRMAFWDDPRVRTGVTASVELGNLFTVEASLAVLAFSHVTKMDALLDRDFRAVVLRVSTNSNISKEVRRPCLSILALFGHNLKVKQAFIADPASVWALVRLAGDADVELQECGMAALLNLAMSPFKEKLWRTPGIYEVLLLHICADSDGETRLSALTAWEQTVKLPEFMVWLSPNADVVHELRKGSGKLLLPFAGVLVLCVMAEERLLALALWQTPPFRSALIQAADDRTTFSETARCLAMRALRRCAEKQANQVAMWKTARFRQLLIRCHRANIDDAKQDELHNLGLGVTDAPLNALMALKCIAAPWQRDSDQEADDITPLNKQKLQGSMWRDVQVRDLILEVSRRRTDCNEILFQRQLVALEVLAELTHLDENKLAMWRHHVCLDIILRGCRKHEDGEYAIEVRSRCAVILRRLCMHPGVEYEAMKIPELREIMDPAGGEEVWCTSEGAHLLGPDVASQACTRSYEISKALADEFPFLELARKIHYPLWTATNALIRDRGNEDRRELPLSQSTPAWPGFTLGLFRPALEEAKTLPKQQERGPKRNPFESNSPIVGSPCTSGRSEVLLEPQSTARFSSPDVTLTKSQAPSLLEAAGVGATKADDLELLDEGVKET